jgi:hypothetical protein
MSGVRDGQALAESARSTGQGRHRHGGDTRTLRRTHARQILDERAKLMALAVARSRSEELNLEVLTFNLGSQRCGIPTRFVFEMLALPTVTPLPGVAPHVSGSV